MCHLHRVRLAAHETELQALIADEHLHRLYGYRVYAVREVVEQRRLQHRHRFLCVAETPLGELQRLAAVVLCDYLRAFKLFQLGRKRRAYGVVRQLQFGAVRFVDVVLYARYADEHTVLLETLVSEPDVATELYLSAYVQPVFL